MQPPVGTWTGVFLRTGAVALTLFVLSMGFSLLLSSSMLKTFAGDVLLGAYANTSQGVSTGIERGLRFGRPLNRFIGLEGRLIRGLSEGVQNLVVLDPAGGVAASAKPVVSPHRVAASVKPASSPDLDKAFRILSASLERSGKSEKQRPDALRNGWLEQDGSFLALRPLRGIGEDVQGFLLIQVDAAQLEAVYRDFVSKTLLVFGLLAVSSVAALLGWTGFCLAAIGDIRGAARAARRVFIVFLGGAQVVLVGVVLLFFTNSLTTSTRSAAEVSGRFLAQDLEFLAARHVRLEGLSGLREALADMVGGAGQLGGARLLVEGREAASTGVLAGDPVRVPVLGPIEGRLPPRKVAELEIFPDRAFFWDAFRRLALDQATTLAISFLLLVELSGFAVSACAGRARPAPTAVVRIGLFLFFFGYDMVLSFIPLAAAELPGTLPFVPADLLRGLPISMEAFLAGIGVFLAGIGNARFGWKRLLLAGVAFAVLGAVLGALAGHIGLFTAARALSGLGFGMTLMASQFSVFELDSGRAAGLASLYAGLFAGSICGTASGGMAYAMFGTEAVFWASGALLLTPFCLLPLLPAVRHGAEQIRRAGSALLAFVRSPSVLVPIVLVSLPASMSLTGFLYLSVPTLLQRIGVDQADIGRLFMAYGFCFVLIGPILGRLADRALRSFVCATVLFAGAALLAAFAVPTYWGMFAAVLCMGISQCLLASSLVVYVLGLPALRGVDAGIAGSACRLFERGGQVIGPVFFGIALSLPDGQGFFLLGVSFCVAGLLFAFMARKPLS